MFKQLRLSFHMTVAAARMTMRYPQTILVALANLAFLVVVAVAPLVYQFWLMDRDPQAAYAFFKAFYQFWIVDSTLPHDAQGNVDFFAALFSADWDRVLSAFVVWLFVLYFLWATIVAFASLVTATIIMHTGIQQLRGQKPSIADGWEIARKNMLRLAGLAVIAGAAMTFVKRALMVLRVVPVVGKWIQRAVMAVLTFALYLALPVVVYERDGVWSSVKSVWNNARKTWGGLVVGTGLMLSALWMGLWVVNTVFWNTLSSMGVQITEESWTTIVIMQIIAAVALYCVNIALSANLRAALYLHVTEDHTGVLPEGALVSRPAAPAPAPLQAQPTATAGTTRFDVVRKP